VSPKTRRRLDLRSFFLKAFSSAPFSGYGLFTLIDLFVVFLGVALLSDRVLTSSTCYTIVELNYRERFNKHALRHLGHESQDMR
jgi:hypothetical protein